MKLEQRAGNTPADREILRDGTQARTAVRVSLVSIIGNSALTAFKLLAGILAHSGAMVSDAVHSASDVLASLNACHFAGSRHSSVSPHSSV